MDSPTRLREFRLEAGLSQQALADRVGLAQQNLARYELGTVEPKARLAVRIAQAVGTTVEAVWQLEEATTETPNEQEPEVTTISEPLITIGKYGRRTHAQRFDGRAVCEQAGPHLTRDADGGYTDKTLVSDVVQTGRRGHPTCSRCQRELVK